MKKFIYILLVIILLSFSFSLAYSKEVEEDKENISSTQDKSAIFFGDSISYGAHGSPKGYAWANYLGDNYDFKECVNAGKSGWFISYKQNKKWLVNSMYEYKDKVYDYVILHGGTNDISREVPLGSYDKNDFSGRYDNETFIGGLETYIYVAKKYWPNAKIGYIINYKTPLSNKNRSHLSVIYYNKMKEVLKKWNVPYLNLFNGKAENNESYDDILKVYTRKYLPDALHLNKEGYDVISPYIYDWIKNL